MRLLRGGILGEDACTWISEGVKEILLGEEGGKQHKRRTKAGTNWNQLVWVGGRRPTVLSRRTLAGRHERQI